MVSLKRWIISNNNMGFWLKDFGWITSYDTMEGTLYDSKFDAEAALGKIDEVYACIQEIIVYWDGK